MEKEKTRPTQERVKELFHYDPETGIFTRRIPGRSGPKERKYGKVGAGRISELGYVMIMVDGTNYIAASLAWLYTHGVWPSHRTKYINGNRLDNRLSNIRVQSDDKAETSKRSLTHDRLKELLHYEPETGWFTWRVSSAVTNPGDRAGGGHGLGYRAIGIDYRKYLEHILAWFYVTGELPTKEVDHINADKSDNRWSNLRLATRSQNGHNKNLNTRNKTGVAGVHKHGNRYRVRISVDGKDVDCGSYSTVEQAAAVRYAAEREHIQEFTNMKRRTPHEKGVPSNAILSFGT